MDYYVYAHFDQNNVCRYIGKGRSKRAWRHGQRSKRWREIFTENNQPIVKILANNLTEKQALESEIHLISEALKRGEKLLNVTAGGELFEGWDERARSLLSEDRKGEKTWTYGIPRPEETKAKISATKRANPERNARYWAGKKRDPELIKKLVAAAHTPEALKKSADKKRGKKHSEEHKLKIKESSEKKSIFCITTGEEFESINEAARVKGISCGRVSEVVNGVRKSAKGLQFKFKDCQ
jgi:hypothetical protein